jgi:universal stress protein A
MITVLPESRDNLLVARASGKLTHEDYEQFRGRLDRLLREHGKVRVLLELTDFHGWEARAAWDDLMLGLRHYGRFERCAVVGDRKWEEWLVALARPFWRVEYFDARERDRALAWLQEPEEAAAGPGEGLWPQLVGFVRRHPVPCALIGLGLAALALGAFRATPRLRAQRT